MENQLDPVHQDETTDEPGVIDESSRTLTTQPQKASPGKAVTKPARMQEELPPNPLLLDPYQWDLCTITVGYSLLPNGQVSVSVHNHKDEPIVKEFHVDEVPLPEKINGVMATLQGIWPASPVNTTVVLLPKLESTQERPIIASVRVSTDTPIVQEGVESDLPFPTPIIDMLEELKELLPARALKNIEKNTKAKTTVKVKATNKTTTLKVSAPASTPVVKNSINKSQLTLF